MATIAYLGDGSAIAPDPFSSDVKKCILHRRLKVADIIASDATMTTNGYITANDIVQVMNVPLGFVFDKAVVRIVTAATADVNIEVGLAGGAEAIASFDLDGTAGTMVSTIETDSWAGGKCFYAADTIDVQFITANAVVGEFDLWVFGHVVPLGVAS